MAVAWAALVLSSRARVTSVRLRVGSMDETSGGPQPSAPSCEVGTVPRRTGGCLREKGNSHTLTAMGRKWTACTDGQARRPPLGLGRLMARGVRSGAARLPRSLSPTGRSPGGPRRLPAPGSHRSVRAGLPHTAPRIRDSLRDDRPTAPPGRVEADTAQAPSETDPIPSVRGSSAGPTTSAKCAGPHIGSAPGPGRFRLSRSKHRGPGAYVAARDAAPRSAGDVGPGTIAGGPGAPGSFGPGPCGASRSGTLAASGSSNA